MNYLLNSLRTLPESRGVVFIALGKISMAVGANILPYLENIITQIKSVPPIKGKQFYPETLTCISMLAIAVRQSMVPHIPGLLPQVLQLCPLLVTFSHALTSQMFMSGLCVPLTDSLRDLAKAVPSFAQVIQERLLDLVSMILCNKPFGVKRLNAVGVQPTPQV